MIVVRVELWPHGDRARAELLGLGVIANDGTGTESVGNYLASFSAPSGFDRRQFTGSVQGFPRRRLSAWHLLGLAIRSAFSGGKTRGKTGCGKTGKTPIQAEKPQQTATT